MLTPSVDKGTNAPNGAERALAVSIFDLLAKGAGIDEGEPIGDWTAGLDDSWVSLRAEG